MEQTQNSRRKQCRPARSLSRTAPPVPAEGTVDLATDSQTTSRQDSSSSSAEEPTSENLQRILQQVQYTMKELCQVHVKSEPAEVDVCISPDEDLPAGQLLGPFPFRILDKDEDTHYVLMEDSSGSILRVKIISDDPVFQKLKCTKQIHEANCIIYMQNGDLYLFLSRAVPKEEALVAVVVPDVPFTDREQKKKYACERCNVASFNSFDNLTAHQQKYCRLPNAEPIPSPTVSPTSPPSVSLPIPCPTMMPFSIPGPMAGPSVLFLPLAYHNLAQQNIVQLLGPPQTIVPIAIGRHESAQLPLTPLMVNGGGLNQALPSALSISAGDLNYSLPLLNISTEPKPTPLLSSNGTLPRVIPQMVPQKGTKRPADTPVVHTPLDLTKRQCTSSVTSTVKSPESTPKSSTDLEKPFLCSCGVSFSAEATLLAHQQHYCKDVSRPEPLTIREPHRKLPSRCSQCDFEPHSLSQLSVHVRQNHNEIQAYVCVECGYRGYSQRGIRSHLRSHTHLDHLKFETLLTTHVHQVRQCEKRGDTEKTERLDSPTESTSE